MPLSYDSMGGNGPDIDVLSFHPGVSCEQFYNEPAESYHLIFDTILRQRNVLAGLLPGPANGKRVFDCAYGIGMQGLANARL
jgi:hypothetical protein